MTRYSVQGIQRVKYGRVVIEAASKDEAIRRYRHAIIDLMSDKSTFSDTSFEFDWYEVSESSIPEIAE